MPEIDARRLGELMQAVLRELHEIGEPTRGRVLMARAEPKLNLSEYEKSTAGYHIRWKAHVYGFSNRCEKAGLIQRSNGIWTLTNEGKEALADPPDEFVKRVRRMAREPDEADGILEPGDRQIIYEESVATAREEIEKHIHSLSPYDFQKLVSELLTAMGYHIPFVAPPGPDGGIDIVAYKDPLGTTVPRIRCQVKHREGTKVTPAEVRQLHGVLRGDGDIGLIVSSGGFTKEAERETQTSAKHIEKMDLDRLITLWQQYYSQIREQGKALLPLVNVFFLAPPDE